MKRIISILFVVAIFATVALEGCKKYPEGPAISLRTKTARVAGKWAIEKVIVNGTDSPYDYSDISIEFTKDGKTTYTWGSLSYSGEWKFNDDKTKILQKDDDDTEWSESEILKLKNSEFWTKEVDGSTTTETHLKAK